VFADVAMEQWWTYVVIPLPASQATIVRNKNASIEIRVGRHTLAPS
jgi:hypothetical protein